MYDFRILPPRLTLPTHFTPQAAGVNYHPTASTMSKILSSSDLSPSRATGILHRNLALLKDKLACHQHPENQWCWVDPRTPGADHLPLCLNDIQLWATYLVSKIL